MKTRYNSHSKSTSEVTYALALLTSLALLCVTVTANLLCNKQVSLRNTIENQIKSEIQLTDNTLFMLLMK